MTNNKDVIIEARNLKKSFRTGDSQQQWRKIRLWIFTKLQETQ